MPLEFLDITKTFPGPITALDHVSLSVADGELVVIVGPSGAGKTTALRIVTGLERATTGSISMDGKPIDHLRPKDRDVAMVFQQPALYPHMSVRDNVAFSLRKRGVARDEIGRRVTKIIAELGISDLLDRWPDTLSGGQAQRVALARALVRRPKCLLLDEPFASLDAPMRDELRQTLRAAHARNPLTTLFVTHDQDEALALADRLVVIRAGRIEQVGTPQQVYDKPANRFVAGFLGSPSMNFFEGRIMALDDRVWFESADLRVPVAASMHGAFSNHVGASVMLGVRPEHLTVASAGAASSEHRGFLALVQEREFRGAQSVVRCITSASMTVTALVDASTAPASGASIRLSLVPDRVRYFASDDIGRNLLRQ